MYRIGILTSHDDVLRPPGRRARDDRGLRGRGPRASWRCGPEKLCEELQNFG